MQIFLSHLRQSTETDFRMLIFRYATNVTVYCLFFFFCTVLFPKQECALSSFIGVEILYIMYNVCFLTMIWDASVAWRPLTRKRSKKFKKIKTQHKLSRLKIVELFYWIGFSGFISTLRSTYKCIQNNALSALLARNGMANANANWVVRAYI